MLKLEVRCCCAPQKLLGWMEVFLLGREIVFYRMHRDRIERVSLPITMIRVDDKDYPAIKAEGLTQDDFKGVRGFTPAPDA